MTCGYPKPNSEGCCIRRWLQSVGHNTFGVNLSWISCWYCQLQQYLWGFRCQCSPLALRSRRDRGQVSVFFPWVHWHLTP